MPRARAESNGRFRTPRFVLDVIGEGSGWQAVSWPAFTESLSACGRRAARATRDQVLRTRPRVFHAASKQRYGRPPLWKDQRDDGGGRQRDARRQADSRRRDPGARLAAVSSLNDDERSRRPERANVLSRNFTAAEPNQL